MKLASNLIMLFVALLSQIAPAQVATGTPPFGSFGGGPFDTVNLGNLNVNFVIPVFHKAGRGTPFTYDLSYDSSIWTPVTNSGVTQWQPASNWGWRGITEAQTGYLTYQTSYTTDGNGCRTTYYSYVYHDAYGASHAFPGSFQWVTYYFKSGCLGTRFNALTAASTDGSGYHLSVTTQGQLAGQLTDRGGRLIAAPLNVTNGAATYTDNNGNQLSVSSTGVFTDTLGTTALTVSGSGTPSSPTTFTYTAPSGGNAQYKMNYTAHTVATGFSISGIGEYGPVTNVPLVSSILLPDGTEYQFSYESGPSSCSPCVTGRIKEVTLPTGGTITYSYTGGSNGIESDGSTAGLTRTLNPGGQWQYSRTKLTGTPGPGSTWKTTVNDPAGNETDINFAEDSTITNLTANPPTTATYNFYETQRLVKQLVSGTQTLLLTTERCYNGNYTNCASATVSSPIYTIDSYAQPVNGKTRGSHVEYDGSFNGSGLVSVDEEYDYGVTMGASLSSFHALRDAVVSYASLSNQYGPIYDKPSSVAVYDCSTGTCSKISSTGYNYDQTTPTATSGTPQHVSISGSRGNATTTTMSTSSSASLSKTFTYYDTGNVNVATDVNSAQTTYVYGDCGNSFPTTINEPLSLSRSMQWNCTGGVVTQVTDESGNPDSATYTNTDFWRPDRTTDRAGFVTNINYTRQTSVETSINNFLSGSATWDFLTTVDGFGRAAFSQQLQAPGGSTYDTYETDYNNLGQPSRSTMPYAAGPSPSGNGSAPGTNVTYDALGRLVSMQDADGGTVTYTYTVNDVLQKVSGPQTFQKQLEYDGLGRLTSVCEITSAAGNGSCGPNNSATGFLTKYSYDALGDIVSVTQNAQPGALNGTQTRSYTYDWLGRLKQESNPETGTISYIYDSYSSGVCSGATGGHGVTSEPGDLMLRTLNSGLQVCYLHDALHRLTDEQTSPANQCRRFRYDNSANAVQSAPSGYTAANVSGQLLEAETDTCGAYPPTHATLITDEWFGYGPRAVVTDFWESTPHSGGYYHYQTQYHPNFFNSFLGFYNSSGQPLFPTQAMGLNAEGWPNSVLASSGQNPVSSVTYSSNASSAPLGTITSVTFGSQDSDTFQYDPNTGRMTQYSFNVNGQSEIGNLGWNPNGTLASLAITDPFNSQDNGQNCTYSYDSLARVGGVSCGSTWAQTFSYDAFGNISKSGNASWLPNYNNSKNQYVQGWNGASYDANGNALNDTFNTYTWDVYGNLSTANGATVTNDAFDRMVENQNGTVQFVYAPGGHRPFAFMNGQNLANAVVPLPGGAFAIYNPSGLAQYNHPDWLGSARLFSAPNRGTAPAMAYAPFGEGYAGGIPWDQFTAFGNPGTIYDTEGGSGTLLDFQYRRYSPGQGRWISPDPAGLAAVDATNPQTWNRYAYVGNNPLSRTDPLGLYYCACEFDDGGGGGGGDPSGGDPCFLYGIDCGGQGPSGPPSLPGGGGSDPGPPRLRRRPKGVSDCSQPPPGQPTGPAGLDVAAQASATSSLLQFLGGFDKELQYGAMFSLFCTGCIEDYKQNVNPRGPLGDSFADFGNFNFGANCAGAGMSLVECQSDAGIGLALRSMVHGIPDNGSGIPFVEPCYGDQCRDSAQIQAGYQYYQWEKDCRGPY